MCMLDEDEDEDKCNHVSNTNLHASKEHPSQHDDAMQTIREDLSPFSTWRRSPHPSREIIPRSSHHRHTDLALPSPRKASSNHVSDIADVATSMTSSARV